MKLTKLEVQKRVSVSGKPIPLKDFDWCEHTKTFSSDLDELVIDFDGVDGCTFNVGDYCTFSTSDCCAFNTSYNCVFNTGRNCTFNTGHNCTFKTGAYCTFSTSSDCTFNTEACCTFNTGTKCVFNTGYNCTFRTGSSCTFYANYYCTFNTGHYCTFNTNSNCAFNTGACCTFNTHSDCTFKTGTECVVVRRDTFEVIQLKGDVSVQTCPYLINGYLEDGYLNGNKSLGKYIIVDGILSKIISQRGAVYKVINHGETKESFIVQDEEIFAHGDTIKEAREDLKYKIGKIDASEYKELTLNSVLSLADSIRMYRAITKACAKGTRYFVESQENVKSEYTIREIIDLTEGEYGNKTLKDFNFKAV